MDNNPPHPMQPLVWDGDTIRFKKNAIVRFLLDTNPHNLEKLAFMDFSDEDRVQLAQLIGYSVSGFSELDYVSDKVYEKADRAREEFALTKKPG